MTLDEETLEGSDLILDDAKFATQPNEIEDPGIGRSSHTKNVRKRALASRGSAAPALVEFSVQFKRHCKTSLRRRRVRRTCTSATVPLPVG